MIDQNPGAAVPRTLVIYHADCVDGFTAAWVCWLKFGDSAEYIPAKYGDAPPDCAGRDVYIVDFSYPRAALHEIGKTATSITVFDHHKTAAEDLRDLDNATCRNLGLRVVFDMERSGAGITWDELHNEPTITGAGLVEGIEYPRPWLVNYVEDRDLWRHKLPHTADIAAFMAVQPKTFQRWNEISLYDKASFAAQAGVCLVMARDQYVDAMRAHARRAEFLWGAGETTTVPIVNAPPHAISDLLGALASEPGVPFAVGWFQRGDGMYQYSLRSRGDGGADVSAIAKAFGGGGHRGAAGFVSKERVDL